MPLLRRPARAAAAALCTAALCTAALAGAPGDARAQAVRVTAVDSTTGVAIPNALLTAADSLGRRVANAATGAGGPRLLALPGAGAYRVTLRRIGRRPYTSPLVRLGARDTVTLALRVPVQPVLLAGVHVRAQAECGRAADPEVAALWDQIRTAITLVALREDSADAPRPDVHRYALRLGADARTVLTHTVLPAARGRARPFGTFAPESLAAYGYVRRGGATAIYIVPDEAVLLSDGFAANHCFEPVTGEGAGRGLVGLAFSPPRTHRTPDVAGVLWADSATAALRYLEFSYVDDAIPEPVRGPGFADGEVHFSTLPDGNWATVAWRLRVPYLSSAAQRDLNAAARFFETDRGTRLRLDPRWVGAPWQFLEVGAVAAAPGDSGYVGAGETAALARIAALVRPGQAVVRVRDAAGNPVRGLTLQLTQEPDAAAAGFTIDDAGARLGAARLTGAVTAAVSDMAGVAAVAAVPPGRYLAQALARGAGSPYADAYAAAGVEPPTAYLVVTAAGTGLTTIAPPSLAALDRRCPRRERGDTLATRLVYGAVVDETSPAVLAGGLPPAAARARVMVRWSTPAGGRESRRTTTDDAGAFVVCGIPQVAAITAEAAGAEDAAAAPQFVATGEWRAAYVGLVLRAPTRGREGPRGAGTLVVAGTVVDSIAGRPLPGALVQIVDATRPATLPFAATTDSVGAFRMTGVPPGRYFVAFSHPMLDAYGLTPESGISDLSPEWNGATLALAVPGPARVRASACARTRPLTGAGPGVLVGRVVDARGSELVERGRVQATWPGGDPSLSLTMAADISGGVFRLCGVPEGTRVTLAAELPDGRRSAPVDVVVPPSGVAARDLVVRPPR